MIVGRQILRLSVLCAGVLAVLATPSTAQSTGGAPAPLSDADITRILAERIDAQQQSVGIVVGVLEPGGRRVLSHGHPAKGDPRRVDGDTVFEIGSITKVFTALLLADAVERGEVALSDPVTRYLPASVKVPQRGRAITLGDLASHVSGLPRLPTNMASTNPRNPYADYTVDQLYAFLSGYELPRDAGAQYEYSNLGGGLLGHVLALRAGMTYEALVEARITRPLGMTSTRITLSDDMRSRLASGYDAALQPADNWDLPTLAGAGALRSTVNDLLLFLSAAMGERPTPLAKAFAAMTTARRPAGRAGARDRPGLACVDGQRPRRRLAQWRHGRLSNVHRLRSAGAHGSRRALECRNTGWCGRHRPPSARPADSAAGATESADGDRRGSRALRSLRGPLPARSVGVPHHQPERKRTLRAAHRAVGVRDLPGVAARVLLQGRGCAADVRSRSGRAGDRDRAASGGSRHSRRAGGSLV